MADILYTGKGLATKLPTDNGSAMNRLSDFIVKAEELKYKTFRENEKEFLKSSNVDPLFFISDKSQRVQTELLSDFNNKWAQEYKKYQGNLPMSVKQQMQSEKNIIIAQQQKMQSDMERAMQDRNIISKDVRGELDHIDADKRWNDYINTGTYDTSPLQPSAIDPDYHYSKNINKGTGTASKVKITTNKGGKVITEEKYASASEEEARQMVEADILSSPRIAKGFVKKFQALKETDPDEYKRRLDTNKDDILDKAEEQEAKQVGNPIIEWAKDTFWQKRIIVRDIETTKPETTKKTGGSSFTGFGKPINYDPTEARSLKVGQTDYSSFHDFGNIPVQDVTVKEIRVLNPEGETVMNPESPISADLIGYDENKDEFIFIATKDFLSVYNQFMSGKGKDWRFAVKKADLPDKYKEWEIIKDGKTIKVGSVASQVVTTPTETPAEKLKRLKEGK